MNSVRSLAAAASAFSAVSTRESPFLGHLQMRDQNLLLELQKLDLSRQKLEKEVEALVAEKEQLNRREQKLKDLEQEVIDQERRHDRIAALQRQTLDTERQNGTLQKMVDGLRERFAASQSELGSAREKLKQKRAEAKQLEEATAHLRQRQEELVGEVEELRRMDDQLQNVDMLVQAARGKTIGVERLRNAVEVLKEEVAAREAELAILEPNAHSHQQQLQATSERNAALARRRLAAEAKKRSILDSLAERDTRRRALLDERDCLRRRREAAEREEEELQQVEGELRLEEDRLQELRHQDDEEMRLAMQENERQMKAELERANVERLEGEKSANQKSQMEELRAKYEADSAVVQRRYDRLEKAALDKKGAVELEQTQWVELWNEKLHNADGQIAELEAKIKGAESSSALRTKLAQLLAEHEQLKRRVADETEDIRRLSEGPESGKELLDKMEREIRDQRERIAKMERQLDEEEMEQKAESQKINLQEEDLRVGHDELEKKMQLFQLRKTAALGMIDLYQRQLAAAQRRCQSLRLEREQIKGDSV
jgi:chromosome segregation ATPase